jgi:hypothetical protein
LPAVTDRRIGASSVRVAAIGVLASIDVLRHEGRWATCVRVSPACMS